MAFRSFSSNGWSDSVHQAGPQTCYPVVPRRGEKHGFITYRCSEHAALSLQNGAALRKRSEPSFQLSSGGPRHFRWPRHTDYGKLLSEAQPGPEGQQHPLMT